MAASASSPSSVQSCEDSVSEKPKCPAMAIPSSVLLLSSDLFRPFKSNIQSTVALQSSISLQFEKWFRFLRSAASENPCLKNFMSLSSHLHASFCKIPCREIKSLNSMSNHSFAAILPGDSVAGLVVSNGISNFLNIYNTLLVVRLVLTWFPNTPPAIVSPLSTICDPYLNIFRGLIPPLGGTLDLSPILAFLVLNALTSTAAALPAELPVAATGVYQEGSCHVRLSGPTTSEKKWMRRLWGNRSKCSGPAR